MKHLLVLLLLITTSICLAESATQTDWSGGPEVWGPVIDLQTEFLLDTDVNWTIAPGSLQLGLVNYTVTDEFEGVISVYSTDIDGDGDKDILGAKHLAGAVIWWENSDGSGSSWEEHLVASGFYGAYSVCSGDINGDGNSDIIGAADDSDEIWWWENIDGSGEVWIKRFVTDSFQGARSVCSIDIDGDGDLDIAGAAYDASEICWWENTDGSGFYWSCHIVDSYCNGARAVCSQDIDGDGDVDLIGAAFYAGDVFWYENTDGYGGIWVKKLVNDNCRDVSSVSSEDIDGDGDMDIAGASRFDDEIVWWENLDGSGDSWSDHVIASEFASPRMVTLKDIDGDGDIDAAGVAYQDDEITWWENLDGSGVFWSDHVIHSDFDAARAIFAEDIDSDGNMDIVGGAYGDSEITWWSVNEYSFTGSLESTLFNTRDNPEWDYIDWNSVVPGDTEVGFQVRATQTGWEATMPPWSDTLWTPSSLEGLLPDGCPYVQYRVVMETSNTDATPILSDVTISWSSTGIEQETSPVLHDSQLLPFSPNPASGQAMIRFSLREPADAEFSVINLTGRVVSSTDLSTLPGGYGSLVLDELPPGVYFCLMSTGDFTGMRRFVVVE